MTHFQVTNKATDDDSIIIVDYQSTWPIIYAKEAKRILTVIDPMILDECVSHPVVHVGSTSVPGLRAKPIIDIAVIVKSRN